MSGVGGDAEGFEHPYLPTSSPKVVREMLAALGLDSIEQLFVDVPTSIRLSRPLRIPRMRSEFELLRHIQGLLNMNRTTQSIKSFLGAGCWPHYVPAVIGEIIARGEFLTPYTPYQPEASQGLLQAFFEYQSMVCELTAMEYANCSLHDWGSALGEAARMAVRETRRRKILVPHFISPERRAVLQTYVEPIGCRVVEVDQSYSTGRVDIEDLKEKMDGDVAALYIENPSYLGFFDQAPEPLAEEAHRHGALFIVGVEPISLGLVKPPGEYGADIVVGEGQPLGLGLNFGGSLLGIIACRGESLLRQMPGRIVGVTTSKDGERALTLVLQTREQHIRRERATSNITTNEALNAVAAAIYLALLGPTGLRKLAETILIKTTYAAKLLGSIRGVEAPIFRAPHFKDFTVRFTKTSAKEVNRRLLAHGIQGGKPLRGEFPELGEAALYCVTEVHSKADIDELAQRLEEVLAHP
jgi:glycine dehydrogenase subunit 1